MPTARNHAAGGAVGGKIYVIGGRLAAPNIGGFLSSNTDIVEEYDPATNAWRPMTKMPTPRSGHGWTTFQGRIYVAGGEGGTVTWTRSTATSRCSIQPSTTGTDCRDANARHGVNLAALGNRLHVIGGHLAFAATGGEQLHSPANEVFEFNASPGSRYVCSEAGSRQQAAAVKVLGTDEVHVRRRSSGWCVKILVPAAGCPLPALCARRLCCWYAHRRRRSSPSRSITCIWPSRTSNRRAMVPAAHGGNVGRDAGRVAFGEWKGDHPLPIQLLFPQSTTARPSAGSAIDHIGFSFADLDAKMSTLRAAGVKVVSPVAEVPGLWKQATIEDPWGTRLELVQDPDALGLHHVELRVPDPEESFRWYIRAFGGDRTKYKGIEAIRYRELGVFYLVRSSGTTTPPQPGTLDRSSRLRSNRSGQGRQRSHGARRDVRVQPESRDFPACTLRGLAMARVGGSPALLRGARPAGTSGRFAGRPGGVRVELVQHLEAGGH